MDLFIVRTNQVFALLNEMATFVKVVEVGSFSEAARYFGSTPSAVSRAIAKLEKELNGQLLQRTTRKLRLSDKGKQVYEHAQEMLRAMQAAVEVAGQAEEIPAGTLRIAAPRALGRFLIHPLIPEFLQRYPQLDLVFSLEDRTIDLIEDEFDLAFRITDEPHPGLMGRPLMRIEHMICATPSYLAQHGNPQHPHDLKHHSCIALSEQAIDARWKFSKDNKNVFVDVKGRYSANNTGVRLDAIKQQLGIGSLPTFIAQPEIDAGDIVQVLPEWEFKTNYHGDVWMLYPQSKYVPLKVRAFTQFMAEKLATKKTVEKTK